MSVITEPITTVPELLERMHLKWRSRKTLTEIYAHPNHGNEATLHEHFDDGKGHSGAFSTDLTLVMWPVFLDARAAGFIEGKLEPGYVSKSIFRLSTLGEAEWGRLETARLDNERIAREKAEAEGKPQE